MKTTTNSNSNSNSNSNRHPHARVCTQLLSMALFAVLPFTSGCDSEDPGQEPLADGIDVSQLQDTDATLLPGEELRAGQALVSDNGRYRLTLGEDGSLEIYDGQAQVWSSSSLASQGQRAVRLSMQEDGNLVAYTQDEVPLWDSQTFDLRDSEVSAQLGDDGVLSLVSDGEVVWRSSEPQVTARKFYEIDRHKFFTKLRNAYGKFNQSQVDGLNYLLANTEKDSNAAIKMRSVWIRQTAYVYATVLHEVAKTWQPITEYGNERCKRYDGGCRYKGRGYVQLTHKYNYSKMSDIVGRDLVGNPKLALEPNIAYKVLSHGMHFGTFTGKRLGDYVRKGKTDYYNARRVVNGVDKASLIKGYAQTFQRIFEESVI